MSGLLWFFICWFLLSAVMTVAYVGKPRKPTTPGIAAAVVLIDALFIAAILYFGRGVS